GLEQFRPEWAMPARLAAEGFELLLDCGIREPAEAARALESGVQQVVIALETWSDPAALRSFVTETGPDRLIFSLDLKRGRPITSGGAWDGAAAATIAREVIAAGIRSLIVLDLAAVGVDEGVPTLPLCREIRSAFPDVHLITGGGVRGRRDLSELAAAGVGGVLVASALHDGRITAEDVAAVLPQSPAG
ncbi:MAG: HisA/HisF-related TIM barrel protein, partial [Maioricimonas sp. JB049]